MNEKDTISEFCIYTMRMSDNLQYIYLGDGEGKFIEKKIWRTGHALFQQTREYDEQTNQQDSELKRQADIYIFCLLNHTTQDTIDPLDMAQWDFYILSTSVLDAEVGDQKRIGLNSLMKLKPLHVKYGDIAPGVEKLAGEVL